MPSYDLRNLLQSVDEPLDPARSVHGEMLSERRIEAKISGEVLRRFALHELLTDEIASAHLAGDVHVLELGRPHQVLTCAVPAQLVAVGSPSAHSPFDVLDELAEFARDVAHGVVLEDVGSLIQPLCGSTRASSTALGSWLRALAAVANGCGRNLDLCTSGSGARNQLAIERLIEELAALPSSPLLPRLFVDHDELRRRLEDHAGDTSFALNVEELLLNGRLIVVWGDGGERCVGPGLHRFQHERAALACGGAVALNLPRVALRAGPWA